MIKLKSRYLWLKPATFSMRSASVRPTRNRLEKSHELHRSAQPNRRPLDPVANADNNQGPISPEKIAELNSWFSRRLRELGVSSDPGEEPEGTQPHDPPPSSIQPPSPFGLLHLLGLTPASECIAGAYPGSIFGGNILAGLVNHLRPTYGSPTISYQANLIDHPGGTQELRVTISSMIIKATVTYAPLHGITIPPVEGGDLLIGRLEKQSTRPFISRCGYTTTVDHLRQALTSLETLVSTPSVPIIHCRATYKLSIEVHSVQRPSYCPGRFTLTFPTALREDGACWHDLTHPRRWRGPGRPDYPSAFDMHLSKRYTAAIQEALASVQPALKEFLSLTTTRMYL